MIPWKKKDLFEVVPKSILLRFFHVFIPCQTGDNIMPLQVGQRHDSRTVRVTDCKVNVAELWTWGLRTVSIVAAAAWLRALSLCKTTVFYSSAFLCCKLQGSFCLMSGISATSDTGHCLSSRMITRCGVECLTSTGAPIELRLSLSLSLYPSTHTHNCSSGFKRCYPFTNFFWLS